MIHARIQPDFESWRTTARRLRMQGVSPETVGWSDGDADTNLLPELFAPVGPVAPAAVPRVPAEFVSLARTVSLHRDPARWALLYRLLWRLTHDEPDLLKITVDDDVSLAMKMEKAVRRDIHKMHAFVRFRKVVDDIGDQMIAWHRPDHFIVPNVGPWFARRFAAMRWTILTPDKSVAWDLQELQYGPGVPASAAPQADAVEDLWKAYYASIFNPARVKVKAMKKEMPVRYWATMPETDLIEDLLKQASPRVETMMAKSKASVAKTTVLSAAAFVPPDRSLPVLKQAAAICKGCDLYCHATQTVFGEGPGTAGVMFVGEQPGDKEDIAGKPFIGPAGQMFNKGLDDAGIDRAEAYVTNAVKHFKFEQQGERRIHAKPNAREMAACRPWLEAEIATVRPKLIVCLGATAAQSLMGPQFRITRGRGQIFADTPWAPAVIATNHPSAILRVPDPAARADAYAHFVADLKIVREQMHQISRQQADESATRMPAPAGGPLAGPGE
jgi:probable DNA metabolism protein